MSDDETTPESPTKALETVDGVEKQPDETLKEFVERVGTEADVDAALLDAALEYIMEWHYADTPPDSSESFHQFLDSLQNGHESEGRRTTEHADDSAVERSTERGRDPQSSVDDAVTESTDDPGPIGIQSVSALEERTSLAFRSGLRGSEPRMLLVRFVGIVLMAPLLGRAMARTWIPGIPTYDQGQALLSTVLNLSPEPAIEFVGMLGFGLYAALILLFTLDVKKRVQGVLLIFGSTLALAVLWSQGVFLPAVDPRTLNGVALVVGFLAGSVVEADKLWGLSFTESTLRRPALGDGRIVEFRTAALALFGVLTAAVVTTLVAAGVAGVLQAVDVVVSLVFVGTLFQFVRYESATDYVTLGPERSGKSMMTVGLCQELLEHSAHAPRPNDYLREGLERTSNLDASDDRWPIPSTPLDEVQVGSFEVIAGSLFPRRLEVRAMDYAGQHLGRIAELFARDDFDTEDESVPRTVVEGIRDADTLLFVLDVERLVFPEAFQAAGAADETDLSWGLDHYGTILEGADPDDTIVVATKCDILVDQGAVEVPSAYDSFEAYRTAVTDHLTTRPDVEHLLELTGESSVRPVGYATSKQDGQYLPYLDSDGNLVPVGYDRLIDELRSRQ